MDPAYNEKRVEILARMQQAAAADDVDGYAEAWDALKVLEAEAGEFEVQECRLCGCTEEEACPGGCTWVEDDLCSQCAIFLAVAGRLAER